jgi:hypothetical protein
VHQAPDQNSFESSRIKDKYETHQRIPDFSKEVDLLQQQNKHHDVRIE